MKLYDHHWIGKGCIVEILYGDHRSFVVQKTFKVVAMDLTVPQNYHGHNRFIVDVYGEHISYEQTWLKLLVKPGFTRVVAGKWVQDYLLESE